MGNSRKIDYQAVNDATDRLAKFKADQFFPELLSNDQLSKIQENRIKKQKKLGYGKVKDVRESDFIIRDGGYDIDGDGNSFAVDDFDIARYMREAEDMDTGTLHDLKIDTRDLKLADNFYDYAFEFRKKAMRAGRAHPPWSRQMWVGAMLFGEVCPKCSDPDWLDINNVPVNYKSINMPEHLCFLKKGKCPKCKRSKWDLIQNHGMRNYTQYAGVIGQRGSKSSLTALLASYVTHRILKFPSLASLSTAMQASTELTGTFVSLTYGKAAGVLWTPFKHIIEEECDWFTDYFELMDHYKGKYGRELYKLNAQFMSFYDRNLRIYPSGPKSQTLRGDTRCVSGSELVSTDVGLMRIDNPRLRGQRVSLRGESHPVVRHLIQGVRDIVRVKLSNGFWIDCTPDHLFEALLPDYSRKNVQAQDLEGAYLTLELNGKFGSGDLSAYAPPKSKHSFRFDALAAIHRAKTFTIPELRELGIPTSKLSRLLVAMKASGDLMRLKRRPDGYIPFSLRLDATLPSLIGKYARGKILDKQAATIPLRDSFALGYLLGAFVADGSYANKQEFRINALDRTRIENIRSHLLEVFGVEYKIHEYVSPKYQKTAYYVSVSTANVRSFFVWLGLSPATARSKTLPWSVLQGTRDMVHGYLCGHLVSDGTIDSGLFMYSTVSRDLAKQLMTLLGHCRIHSNLYYNASTDGTYDVFVDPAFHTRFRKTIASKLTIAKTKHGRRIDFASIRNTRKRYPTFNAPYFQHKDQRNMLYYAKRVMQTGDARCVPLAEYPSKVKKLMAETDRDTVYLRVESVTPLKSSVPVFDISVDSDEHLFKLGPGVVTHNCFGALDELGLFPLPSGDDQEDETSERANADEAHKSLFNSLGTASAIYENLLREGYQTAPPPILFNVSSPYSIRDKMMRLLRQSKTEAGRSILGVQLATWEMNPTFTRQSQFIVDAYNANYEKAERDFGANPPTVHSRFVPVDAYKSGVFVGGKNSHQFVYQYDQAKEVYGKIEIVRNWNGYPSIITIDAGHTNNSFCIVGGHYNFETGKTHATTLLECMPTEGRSVNFNLLYENVILKLAKDLNAVGLGADQWQGIDLLYRIKADMGLNPLKKPRCLPKQYSPKRKDFDNTVEMMRSGNLILPTVSDKDRDWILDGNIDNFRTDMMGKPVQHLMLQMSTVMDAGEGRAPTKGEKMTDDMFRALVLFVATVHHPKVLERLEEARKFSYSGDRVRMPMGAVAGRSGGTFGAMNSRR